MIDISKIILYIEVTIKEQFRRKIWRMEMKKFTFIAVAVLSLFVISACVSSRPVYKANIVAEEFPEETEIIFTTSSPVKYKVTELESFPGIILSFPGEQIYLGDDDISIKNEGPISSIKKEFYPGDGSDRPFLAFLIIELTQDLPYKIDNSGNSIRIVIKNPASSHTSSIVEVQNDKNEKNGGKGEEKTQIIPGYIVGPGDILNIEVWTYDNISRDVTVSENGDIKLPPMKGKVDVLGLNITLLEDKLESLLSKFVVEPIVFVKVLEFNSQRVIAMGETSTGIYPLKKETTLVEFISQIGGPTENADIHNMRLIRKDGSILTYDLNILMNDPLEGGKVLLSGGDTVYFPSLEHNIIYVLGEVRTPGNIPFKENFTLLDAISEAGGYTEKAVIRSIIVVSGGIENPKAVRVNLKKLLKEGDFSQNLELSAGDMVFVPRSFVADLTTFVTLMTQSLYMSYYLRR